jgi:hypothetical protein
MITHGEAREIALAMLPKQVGSISSRNKVRNYFQLDLYFKQQELKELRAKKVEELLGLYQKRFSFYNFDEDKQLREIKVLEEELK